MSCQYGTRKSLLPTIFERGTRQINEEPVRNR